jgi:hypothetical protein
MTIGNQGRHRRSVRIRLTHPVLLGLSKSVTRRSKNQPPSAISRASSLVAAERTLQLTFSRLACARQRDAASQSASRTRSHTGEVSVVAPDSGCTGGVSASTQRTLWQKLSRTELCVQPTAVRGARSNTTSRRSRSVIFETPRAAVALTRALPIRDGLMRLRSWGPGGLCSCLCRNPCETLRGMPM